MEERVGLAKQQTLNGKSSNGNGASLGFEQKMRTDHENGTRLQLPVKIRCYSDGD
jgi:hypothetical protein